MKLKKLHLLNVCQHEDLTIDFHPGVNGIVGVNGSGKTNALRAVRFALTGDWPGTGTKERRVRFGAKQGVVTLWIEANGNEYKIVRALHTSRSRISCEALKLDLSKREEVDKYIEGLLGSTIKLVDAFLFIPQGELHRVITARPADRASYFSMLFGTDRCEKIREHLQSALSSAVQATPSVNRDLVLQQQSALSADHDNCVTTITAATTILAGHDLNAMRVQIGTAQQNAAMFNHPETGMNATSARISVLTEQLKNTDAQLGEREALFKDLLQTIQDFQVTLSDHKVKVSQRSHLEGQRLRRNGLIQKLQEQVRILENHQARKPNPVPDRDQEMNGLEMNLRTSEQRLSELQQLIASFGSGHCAFCKTYAIINERGEQQPIAPLVVGLQQEQANLAPATMRLRQDIENYRQARNAYLQAAASWEPLMNQLSSQIKDLEQMVSETPDPGELPDITASHQVIATALQAEQSFKVVDQQLTILRSSHRQISDELAQRKSRLEQLNAVTLQDFTTAKAQLDRLEQAYNDKKASESKIEQITKSLEYCNQQLELLETQQRSQQVLASWRALLSNALGVLHRDQYPAAVARRHFGRINQMWNHFLAMMDQSFDVQIAPDSTIQLRLPTAVINIEEASGGEIACCAIAFYAAINQIFANNVGLLVLDEPTYGPDAGHVTLIRDVLIELNRWATGGNLQVLVVTHDERLIPAFSHKIELIKAA